MTFGRFPHKPFTSIHNDLSPCAFSPRSSSSRSPVLDDRNIGMANMADGFMQGPKSKSHFFAVGALHYTGKIAVHKLLRKKGYTVKPAFK